MVQAPHDLKGTLQASLAAANRSQADSGGSSKESSKFAMLKETLEVALKALDEKQQVDSVALSGLSKWVADWIPDIDDPLLDRLDEMEQQLEKVWQPAESQRPAN